MPRANRFPVSFAWRMKGAEAERLREVAGAHGLRPAEWARQVVWTALSLEYERRPTRLRILHADLLRGYLRELQEQGDDLAKIARAAAAAPLDGGIAQELAEIRAQHRRLMNGVLDALGADPTP